MSPDKAPWADTPFALIPTPGHAENLKTMEETVFIAREMACAHNGMLRGLNSIYQQCIFVKEPKDIQDLLLYTSFWCDWLYEHHEGEEALLFPSIEKITGVNGLMEANVAQHYAFTEGLKELKTYAKETKFEGYDGVRLRGIIDGFGHKLTTHLTEEIGTLLSLKPYDGAALKKACIEFDAKMRKGDKASEISVPRVGMLTGDRVSFFQLFLEQPTPAI
jgi:hypothetical protein